MQHNNKGKVNETQLEACQIILKDNSIKLSTKLEPFENNDKKRENFRKHPTQNSILPTITRKQMY